MQLGSDIAQEAIIGLVKELKSQEQLTVLGALSLVKKPNEHIEDVVRSYTRDSGDISNTAWLTLTNFGRTLHDNGEDVRASRILDEATTYYNNVKDNSNARMSALQNLGNLGENVSLNIIIDSSKSNSEVERRIAIEALRYYDNSQVREIVLNLLQQDINPEVRSESVRTLAFHEMSKETLNVIVQQLYVDKSEDVRMTLLNALVPNLAKYSEILSFIEKTAKDDLSADVRSQARSIISQYNSMKP